MPYAIRYDFILFYCGAFFTQVRRLPARNHAPLPWKNSAAPFRRAGSFGLILLDKCAVAESRFVEYAECQALLGENRRHVFDEKVRMFAGYFN